jgi:hypothetical protein
MSMRSLALLVLLLLADAGFGQVTFTPVDLAFPQIAIGGDMGGQNYVSLLQIVNNNSSATTAHIALFSDTGSPLAVLFDGAGPQSTKDLTLEAGSSREIALTLNGVVTPGWMFIQFSPSAALTTLIIQFRSGTSLLSEVGVDPVSNTIAATDFSAETDTNLNTGIAVANPSSTPVYVLAALWDPVTGTPTANTVLTLPPNGHTSKLLTELFPGAPGISQLRPKISLDSCSTATCNSAGMNGFLATAIRLNGDQFTTIPVVSRESDGEQIRILPQVAFGGPGGGLNMKTVLYFTTNVATGVFGTAEIFDDGGNPLRASSDGGSLSSSITFTVPGNRVSRVVLSGDETLRSGWVRLTLPSSVHLVTNAVFQTFLGTSLVAEASVLESLPINNGLVYVKLLPGEANVGVAIANTQSDSSTVTLGLFNRDGFAAGTRELTLPANGHLAEFITELFPQLDTSNGFDGALSIHGSTPVSVLALRLNTHKLATLPVSPNGMYRPSIKDMRITRTQRSPAQVNFEVDISDFDSDLASAASTNIEGIAVLDFGTTGYDLGPISIDGTAILNRATGTLSGTFQPPRVTGTVPTGSPATLFIIMYDAAGNESNIAGLAFRF